MLLGWGVTGNKIIGQINFGSLNFQLLKTMNTDLIKYLLWKSNVTSNTLIPLTSIILEPYFAQQSFLISDTLVTVSYAIKKTSSK